MTSATPTPPDQAALAAGLARIRARLEAVQANDPAAMSEPNKEEHQPGTALAQIVARMGLTSFETDLLLLCAGVEMDPRIADLVAGLRGPGGGAEASFAVALAALDAPHWNALSPGRPLRYWKCLTLDSRSPTRAGLSIDERTLSALMGQRDLDERLLLRADQPTYNAAALPPSQLRVAERLRDSWDTQPLHLSLDGPHMVDRQRVVAEAARKAGRLLCRMQAAAIPTDTETRSLIQRLWERESLLQPLVLMIELDDGDPAAAKGFAQGCACPIVFSARRRVGGAGSVAYLSVPTPSAEEQEVLWRAALGPTANGALKELPLVLGQFDLGAADIQSLATGHGSVPLWERCRGLAEPRLAALADRIETSATWDDLVLPERERATLEHLVAQVRNRFIVYHRWGMAGTGTRGRGVTALFSGPSGTGKTLAAEVLANALRLDIYRIDLSAVVSKYIGETEKNLARIFDAAEGGGVVLLFDEADALFGERSQVSDSHDRYANIEIAYLLQRMESFSGLSILTTNIRDAIDTAFVRRIRFLVDFPFPDKALRRAIWAQSFPREVASDPLDLDRLAGLNVAGGTIRTIALNAAFLAADQACPLRMDHIRRAAVFEYDKMGRLMSPAEFEGWS